MDLLRVLVQRQRGRSVAIVGLLTLAGLSDAFGLAALLPVLRLIAPGDATGAESQLDRLVTNGLSAVGAEPTFGTLLAVLCLGTLLRAGFVFAATAEAGRASADFSAELRTRLVLGLSRARWTFFVEQRAGRLASSLGVEANGAGAAYVGLATLAASLIQVLVYLSLAFVAAWQVSLLAGLLSGLMVLCLGRFVGSSRRAAVKYTIDLRDLTARLVDQLGAIKAVRAMGREAALEERLRSQILEVREAQVKDDVSRAGLTASQEPFMIVILAIGIHLVVTRDLVPLDELVFLAFLFQRAMGRVGLLQRQYQVLRSEEAALWSILDAVEQAEEAREVQTGGIAPPTLSREVALEGVGFSHEDGTKVLENFDATVPAGAITGLHGPSGSGKTTMVDLLVALHQPTEGRVLIDGVPLTEVDVAAWRSKVGYVPQDPIMFNDSVHMNVTMGDNDFTRHESRQALERAGAWDFVSAMPGGLDAGVGERGARLSGGQRQRLAIARALIADPTLLILDEATSGLDEKTEEAILATLSGLRGAMTVLLISHQETALAFADHRITMRPVGRQRGED